MRLFDLFHRGATGGPAAVHARLEGSMARRRLKGWNTPLENINALVASGGLRLLARARELVVTNGYAANACQAFAANLVGDGIKFLADRGCKPSRPNPEALACMDRRGRCGRADRLLRVAHLGRAGLAEVAPVQNYCRRTGSDTL